MQALDETLWTGPDSAAMLAPMNAHSPQPPRSPAAGSLARSLRAARPKVAVDTVVFAIEGGRLKTYLVQLRHGAGRGRWAFAGGLVRIGELLDEAARRELLA